MQQGALPSWSVAGKINISVSRVSTKRVCGYSLNIENLNSHIIHMIGRNFSSYVENLPFLFLILSD
jgi:hypothetical protein